MSNSVFGTIRNYLKEVWLMLRSTAGSLATAFPYLIGAGELRKEVTEQYPDPISSKTVDDLPPRTRGLLFNDIERCTGCRDCERACPAQCIRVEVEPGADANKKWVATYDIDFARCILCGLCVEACLPTSLIHTKQYEGAVYELTDLVAKFGRGPVTNEQKAKWDHLRKMAERDEVFL